MGVASVTSRLLSGVPHIRCFCAQSINHDVQSTPPSDRSDKIMIL